MLRPSSHTRMYELDPEELIALLQGNFTTRKCLYCDGTGWVHFKGDGEVSGTGFKRDFEGDDPSKWVDSECCDECYGLGQIVNITED